MAGLFADRLGTALQGWRGKSSRGAAHHGEDGWRGLVLARCCLEVPGPAVYGKAGEAWRAVLRGGPPFAPGKPAQARRAVPASTSPPSRDGRL